MTPLKGNRNSLKGPSYSMDKNLTPTLTNFSLADPLSRGGKKKGFINGLGHEQKTGKD